jgi:hypothetical protein
MSSHESPPDLGWEGILLGAVPEFKDGLLKSEKMRLPNNACLNSGRKSGRVPTETPASENVPTFRRHEPIEKPWQPGLKVGVCSAPFEIPRKTTQRRRARVEFPQRECYDYFVHELPGRRAATALR